MMQSTSMRPSVASFGNVAGLRPRSLRSPAPQPQRMVVRAAAGAAGRVGGGSPTGPQGTGLDFVPDRQKRTVMNLLLVGALGLPGTALLGPFVYFFVPKRCRLLQILDLMPSMPPPPLHTIRANHTPSASPYPCSMLKPRRGFAARAPPAAA